MVAQTNYDIYMSEGVEGGLATSSKIVDSGSYSVETAAGINYARVVSRGATDNAVVLGGATPLGVSMRSVTTEGEVGTGAVSYKQYDTADVLREGYIYAICVGGASAGDAATYDTSTGQLGTGQGGTLTGCTWEQTVATGELGVVRIKL